MAAGRHSRSCAQSRDEASGQFESAQRQGARTAGLPNEQFIYTPAERGSLLLSFRFPYLLCLLATNKAETAADIAAADSPPIPFFFFPLTRYHANITRDTAATKPIHKRTGRGKKTVIYPTWAV